MPHKSVNLSLAAIAKVEKRAEEENRNFSNMLETIINESPQTESEKIRSANEASRRLTDLMKNG